MKISLFKAIYHHNNVIPLRFLTRLGRKEATFLSILSQPLLYVSFKTQAYGFGIRKPHVEGPQLFKVSWPSQLYSGVRDFLPFAYLSHLVLLIGLKVHSLLW